MYDRLRDAYLHTGKIRSELVALPKAVKALQASHMRLNRPTVMRLQNFESNSLRGPTKDETMPPHHAVLPSEEQRRQAMNDWVKDTKGQKHVAERLDHVLDAFEAEFSWKGNTEAAVTEPAPFWTTVGGRGAQHVAISIYNPHPRLDAKVFLKNIPCFIDSGPDNLKALRLKGRGMFVLLPSRTMVTLTDIKLFSNSVAVSRAPTGAGG